MDDLLRHLTEPLITRQVDPWTGHGVAGALARILGVQLEFG